MILGAIPWWPRRGLCYHLVEVSEGLRRVQQERLRRKGGAVRWHGDVRSALAAAEGEALVFSNEFVDAFPCVQLARGTRAGEWREVRVGWPEESEHPAETLEDWSGPVPEGAAEAGLAAGHRVEMHASYRRWLEETVGEWKRGRWLTIDYGNLPPVLWRRRPGGTLRGYCRHQRVVGSEIYRRFGQQDLTADVNFADLQRWGETLGMQTRAFSTQAEFLRRWLPPRTLARAAVDPAFAFLVDPDGAGGAFKALEQSRSL